MTKILANDGISKSGIKALNDKGFIIVTEHVDQNKLINVINEEGYEVLLVRSATTVRKDLIDACPNLKIIGRGGVWMDNIDVEYAKEARMTGEVDSSSQMRGEYFNANVQMIGNGIFSSGQVVYLNPRTGGMSAQDAEDLGLGGYYMVVGVTSEISGENFSTDIGLRYLSARQREEKDV